MSLHVRSERVYITTADHNTSIIDSVFNIASIFGSNLLPICGGENFLSALTVACLTAINRESGAFAAIFYICMSAGRERSLPLAWRSLLLGFVPYVGGILVPKLILEDALAAESTGQ
jgi:hypothetical protein